MSELQKIGVACFIGAVVCASTAVFIGPLAFSTNLLGGVVIGAVAGYLCYDLREVWSAIPRAWQQTKQSASKLILWFVEVPHPTLFSGILMGLLFTLWVATTIPSIPEGGVVWEISVIGLVLLLVSAALAFFAIEFLMNVGAFTLGYHRKNMNSRFFHRPFDQDFPFRKRLFGRRIAISYRSAALLSLLGVVAIIPWMVLFLLVGLYILLERAAKFLWNLFKLIHSNNRTICAIDGPIGGCAAYLFIPISATIDTVVTYILLGGVLGALIGIVNKEFIAKRWLKLA